MSKKANEKKSNSQLSLDLDLKAEDISKKASQNMANQTPTKIVYLDSRQEIYRRILDRNMK